jgi:hypothetical protein
MSDNKYKNLSYDELISYASSNPNRSRTLNSIEVIPIKPVEETSLDKLGLTGYQAFNLNPSGILSLFACISNPSEYSIASKSSRIMTISNLATTFQEQTNDLKNTSISRKRKKIHDLIGAAYNNSHFDDKDYFELFSGLAFMQNVQFILLKSSVQEVSETGEQQSDSSHKGEIVFSSNPSLWKYDLPVWIADFRSRWIAIPTNNNSPKLHNIISSWLSNIEQSGWFINWPEIDATKEDIVQQLSSLPTWSPTDKNLKKEILAKRLGKANVIQTFVKWITKIDSDKSLNDSD